MLIRTAVVALSAVSAFVLGSPARAPESWAGQLDLRDEERMLHENLEEEKLADALLTMLAKGGVNQDAIAVAPI